MSQRAKLKRQIREIMSRMAEPRGGRAAWVEAVKANDGVLSAFREAMADEAIANIVAEILRGDRDPSTGAHLYHSIKVVTGTDDEGKPTQERQYWRASDVYESAEDTDQVVDYYIGQSTAFAKEANLTVRTARKHNRRYQREIPFPDLEGDSDAA